MLWLDVYDASGNRLGEGPIITLQNVSVTRVLDGCGTIQFSTPATDSRVVSLLSVRRRVRIYTDGPGGARELCRGVVLSREFNESSSGSSYTFTCADNLVVLKDYNTLMARSYSQQSIQTVANALIALVPGWMATVESAVASNLIDARFDGASVLKALQQITKNNGVHLRVGTGDLVEIGAFGTLSNLAVMGVKHASGELYNNPNVAIVESIDAGEDAEDVVNWIIPLGAGEDEAALRLKRSTRTTPYTIENAFGPDGRKYFYLRDTNSITTYGQVQRVISFKDIAPISNSLNDRVNAANALYDAAAAWLQRASIPSKTYRVRLRNVKQTLRPGDKINLRYSGRVTRSGQTVDYVNISGDFWIVRAQESIDLGGHHLSLEISNVDLVPEDAASMIVNTIEEVALRNLKPLTSAHARTYIYNEAIAPGFPVIVPVEITNATLELVRLRVRVKTRPFRATSQAAEASGDHRHLIALRSSAPSGIGARRYYDFIDEAATLPVTVILEESDIIGQTPDDLYTYGSSGVHTHPLEYGISDDTETPTGLSVRVNGTNRTSELGGPFMPSGGNGDFVLDIGKMTAYLEDASGGLYQEHQLDFRCTGGRGLIQVQVEVYEIAQTIAVT
jgi:hypothetical protein